MKKYAADIEASMAFLMGGDLKKSLAHSDGMTHLIKARNLLKNAGLTKHCQAVDVIIERASIVDDSDIEVSI